MTRMLPSINAVVTVPQAAALCCSTPRIGCTLRGRRRPTERAAVRVQRLGGACGAQGAAVTRRTVSRRRGRHPRKERRVMSDER